ncbi:MAG: hypothetical protein Q8O33_17355 [Pseudomonadota bacterium]|nr:hypothetical protein [Pseudomonadota bacterium]
MLGFSNRWYPLAAASATRLVLPSGKTINLISAPAFLATKFEAFKTRGQGDPLMSHDLEDIINVVEGRTSIEANVSDCERGLRAYLAAQFGDLAAMPDFQNVLPGLVAYDELHSRRVDAIMRKILAFAALPLL